MSVGSVSGASAELGVERCGVDEELFQIGHVATRVGLSLRTIRYYDEIGLVVPSGRTTGRYRLYDHRDVERLLLVKRMKPLGYTLEEMARLLALLETLDQAEVDGSTATAARRELHSYVEAVAQRIDTLRTHLAYAQEFHERVLRELDRRSDGHRGQ